MKGIYSFVLPPGLFVLLLVMTWFIVRRQGRKSISRLIAITAFLAYMSSTSLVGALLSSYLEKPVVVPSNPRGDVVLVLGEGISPQKDVDGFGTFSNLQSLLTAVKLYRKLHIPILASGGQVSGEPANEADTAKRDLIAMGIPTNEIFIDNRSLNTNQQAIYSKRILDAHHFVHPILIASASHMPRSVVAFSKVGVSVLPYPDDFDMVAVDFNNPSTYLPSVDGISLTYDALHEYLGMLDFRK